MIIKFLIIIHHIFMIQAYLKTKLKKDNWKLWKKKCLKSKLKQNRLFKLYLINQVLYLFNMLYYFY